MAKKARTPKPPRAPVQAPTRRDTKPSGSSALSAVPRWAWPVIGLALVIALAIVAAVALSGGGKSTASDSVKATMVAAGCTYKEVAPLPPKKDPTDKTSGYHADVPRLTVPMAGLWSTFPPSGGAHWYQWALWGFYRAAVNPRLVVHNLEHGGVVMWWGPGVSKSTVDQLQAFYQASPNGMFGTPLDPLGGDTLGKNIALTAWTAGDKPYYHGSYGLGHVAICPKFDEHAFTVFRDAFRGKGPEGIPITSDTPGT